jgi:hypothetical protein
MPLLSLEQLEQMYYAIMRGQIADTSTISRVIAQFEAVAADPVLGREASFDGAGAAEILRQHLAGLEEAALPPPLGEPPDAPYQPPDAPFQPPNPPALPPP